MTELKSLATGPQSATEQLFVSGVRITVALPKVEGKMGLQFVFVIYEFRLVRHYKHDV